MRLEPKILNKWWKLEFADFVKALGVNLSLQQKDELLSLFEKYKKECQDLDSLIDKTNDEINR
ncbi:MAG: hypothetical protein WD061_00430 [Candidatus Saccharimonadales bacterium]